MSKIEEIIKDPLVMQALSPPIAYLVLLAVRLFDSAKPDLESLLRIIDERLATQLRVIATSDSKTAIEDAEVRAHELVTLMIRWQKS